MRRAVRAVSLHSKVELGMPGGAREAGLGGGTAMGFVAAAALFSVAVALLLTVCFVHVLDPFGWME